MDKGSLGILVPILAISIGLFAVIGHHVMNYVRIKNGYAPINANGKAEGALQGQFQQEVISLKAEVDRLRGVEMELEKLKQRVAVLEKIATDPAQRLSREIEHLA
jgi:hypothetical protein